MGKCDELKFFAKKKTKVKVVLVARIGLNVARLYYINESIDNNNTINIYPSQKKRFLLYTYLHSFITFTE